MERDHAESIRRHAQPTEEAPRDEGDDEAPPDDNEVTDVVSS
jgi:hypothetical protein